MEKVREGHSAETIPLKISIVRPKTGVDYWTLLWDDSIHDLGDLLRERERDGPVEHLFVNQYGKEIVEADIQWTVRRLADRTGLEKNRHTKMIYRFRPHEFRDYFKTTCENFEVPNTISEFCLGHTVDPLSYNKFGKTKDGEERVRLALMKARPKLNVLTGYTVTDTLKELPYLTEAVEWISLFKDIPKEQVEKGILAVLKRSPAFARALQDYKPAKWHMADETGDPAREVALGMPRDEVFPSVLSYVESLPRETPAKTKLVQKVIPDDELQKYIDEGWEFRSVINTHSVLVERESQ